MLSSNVEDPKTALLFYPPPRSEWTLISQGAEARVWKLKYNPDPPNGIVDDDTMSGKKDDDDDKSSFIVCKERFSKTYRHPDLDARLTKSRCRSEAKILEKCASKSKIRVPKVIRIDPPKLFLEYLNNDTVKAFLLQQSIFNDSDEEFSKSNVGASRPQKKQKKEQSVDLEDLAQSMGTLVGQIHNIGVVHGDLTTSNMMLLWNDCSGEKKVTPDDGNDIAKPKAFFELALIDFGLAKSTTSVEEQAVDLYVLERALQSTHPNLPESFFDSVSKAYLATTAPVNGIGSQKTNSQSTLQRLEQVRLRGRKRECFG